MLRRYNIPCATPYSICKRRVYNVFLAREQIFVIIVLNLQKGFQPAVTSWSLQLGQKSLLTLIICPYSINIISVLELL